MNNISSDTDYYSLPYQTWRNDLICCPSQCYYWTRDKNGVDCILYMRWRWDDPWQGHIIRNAKRIDDDWKEWSKDILAEFDFEHDSYEDAQNKLAELFAVMEE